MSKIPQVKKENRLLIVCEGYEEEDYLKKLKSINVWNTKISIDIKNARSIDNIPNIYLYNFQSSVYKLIVVFCDTEMHPHKQFESIRKKINDIHGNTSAKHIVFFANPCTMQIILSHFDKVEIKSNSKRINASIIQKLTGIENYEACENQRTNLFSKITSENYATMKENIKLLEQDYKTCPSSNIITLFKNLEADSIAWIKKIKEKIDK